MLFSIAKACKERNNRVIYFAGYRKPEDFFKRETCNSLVTQHAQTQKGKVYRLPDFS